MIIQGLSFAIDGSDLFLSTKHSWYFMIDFISDVDSESAQNIMASLDKAKSLVNQINIDFEQALQNALMREKLHDIVSELRNVQSILEKIKAEYSTAG